MRILSLSCLFLVFLAACGGADRQTAGEPAPLLSTSAPASLHILVIGGTSGVGLETVKLALNRGHQLTAMARHPERLTLVHDRLAIVQGDVLDAASVVTAMTGHDVVVFTISIGPTRKPVTVFSRGASNILEAMQKLGVPRLIAVTGIGAGDSRGHGSFTYDHFIQPFLLKTMYEDKDRSEVLIRDSNVNWTIVRPGFLNDDASEANYRVVTDISDITAGDISRSDVAHYIVAVVEADGRHGETVLLTN
jgi:putative NADH-flavin reductase